MDFDPVTVLISSICSIIGIVYLVYKGINIMLNNHGGREFR